MAFDRLKGKKLKKIRLFCSLQFQFTVKITHTVVFEAKCSFSPVLVKLFLCRDFYYF